MQISILQGSTTGTAVYVETQTPNTNANGLVSIEIGSGAVVNGECTVTLGGTGSFTNGMFIVFPGSDLRTAINLAFILT